MKQKIEFFLTNNPENLSEEYQNYLNEDFTTKLPPYIKQSSLLQFDSNFESGNLDSVYLDK